MNDLKILVIGEQTLLGKMILLKTFNDSNNIVSEFIFKIYNLFYKFFKLINFVSLFK